MPLVVGDSEVFEDVYEQTKSALGWLSTKAHMLPTLWCLRALRTRWILEHSMFPSLMGLQDVPGETTSGEWTESTPGKLGEADGEIVLTIVPKVVKKSHMHRTFVSQIISQRCTCMSEYLKMVNTNLFSFTLPLRIHDVLGSSVFNMEGKWVGHVTHHPTTSAGMRFGMRGDDFQHTLPKWMGEKQWEDIIQPYVEHELYLESIFDWQ